MPKNHLSLDEKLFEQMISVAMLTDERVGEIADLILQGANVNLVAHGRTVLQTLIKWKQYELLQLASDHGANWHAVPDSALKYNTSHEAPELCMFSCEMDPLHLAAENLRDSLSKSNQMISKKIYNLARQKYQPPINIDTIIPSKIVSDYCLIKNKVKEALEKFHISKKPILLLIGESHNFLYSSYIEILAIIAAKEFKINKFLAEESLKVAEKYNSLYASYNEHNCVPPSFFDSVPCFYEPRMLLRILSEKLAVKFEVIDLGFDGATFAEPLLPYEDLTPPLVHGNTVEGMQYRDKVMVAEMKKRRGEHILVTVGSDHLHNLVLNENLSSAYELIAINSMEIRPNKTEENILELYDENFAIILNAIDPHELYNTIVNALSVRQELHYSGLSMFGGKEPTSADVDYSPTSMGVRSL